MVMTNILLCLLVGILLLGFGRIVVKSLFYVVYAVCFLAPYLLIWTVFHFRVAWRAVLQGIRSAR